MKIFSWNVNGLRAVLNKGSLKTFLTAEHPDILCLQEIKCKPDQIDFSKYPYLDDYKIIMNSADRPGYSGTALLVSRAILGECIIRDRSEVATEKERAVPVKTGDGDACLENAFAKDCVLLDTYGNALNEGRIQTLDCDSFYLVNVYTPNSKPDLSRLPLRQHSWDPAFAEYLETLAKTKPVITCGDFNAAHQEIDLARPKTNHHHAGFTDEERQGITNLLAKGFIDTFRTLHPTEQKYTWWSHYAHARENNVGWRIDYFFISQSLKPALKSAEIYNQYLGSDHCPISIEIEA
jgi:exodeoxyribonuclease-3